MAKGKSSNVKSRGKTPQVAVATPRPWGLIAATMAVVVFAAVVIGYAVVKIRENSPVDPTKGLADVQKIALCTSTNNAAPCLNVETFQSQQHAESGKPVVYKQSPPFGGKHDPTWADCTGTVYAQPIRNENAVHTLEHGAVWVTYQPSLPAGDVAKLKGVVDGKPYTLMSPYPNLRTPVSLQAWGYQLFLDRLDMGLVKRFIRDLRSNPKNAPEPGGSCLNADFKAAPEPPGPSVTPTPSGKAPSGSPRPSGSATVPTRSPTTP
ncbi:MAG TPA: DUF3105 domain-containing protein [Mycobacteriales bacterium]|nr:DUF3105 domain-containing protein [Mycobacteriales bacterium]